MSTDANSINIRVIKPTRHAMYCHYRHQTSPQPAHIQLDTLTRTLEATFSEKIGQQQGEVRHGYIRWYGRIRRYPCPILRDDAAAALLLKIAPLAVRVCDGYTTEWDGLCRVGRLTDDAQAAEAEIVEIIKGIDPKKDGLHVMGADVWLGPHIRWLGDDRVVLHACGPDHTDIHITANTTDEEIETVARQLPSLDELASENIILDHPTVEEYLSQLRDLCSPQTNCDEDRAETRTHVDRIWGEP